MKRKSGQGVSGMGEAFAILLEFRVDLFEEMTLNTDLKEVSESVIQRRRSLSAGRSDSAKALAAMLG